MKKRNLLNIIIVVAGLMGLMDTVGCRRSGAVDCRLNLAEELMEERPDSALYILNGIDGSELRGSRIKARYALLKSMALDKNYIDTMNFDVLQPAIDYYLSQGTPDEKLRTYYYQGVIYKNAGNDDQAMESYMKGFDVDGSFSDSLTFARMLVAQGLLYSKQYRIEVFVDNNLKAAELYGKLGKLPLQLKSGLRALTGEIILSNRRRADSILIACKSIVRDAPSLKRETLLPFLKYAVNFGTEEEVRNMIEEVRKADMEDDMNMTLAMAYSKIGYPEKGLQYLNEAKIAPENILDSLTYWSVKTEILEKLGEGKAALEAFKNYSSLLDGYHAQLFSNELLFSEKKHEMELENMATIQKRDRMIKWILVVTAVLLIITLLIYYRYRLNKTGRLLAERNAEKLQLEGERQRLLAEKLDAEGRELLQKNETLRIEEERQRLLAENLESERAMLQLEAENLHHKIGEMEGEQSQLKELLDSQETLSEEARQLIRERIGLLNGLIAQALTEQESYGKEFKSYIARIKKDKKGFQESLVKMFETTHPEFMAYLKEHGLTERELNYCCLYAIGLRGKEIGIYLDLARHYNISTEVRRKLGLDPNDRNLGPYLQEKLRKR